MKFMNLIKYRLEAEAGDGNGGSGGSRIAELEAAIAKLTENNAALLDEKMSAKKNAEAAALEAAKKAGDLESFERSSNEKLLSETSVRDAKIAKLTAQIDQLVSGSAAQKLAMELTGDAGLAAVLLPHVAARVRTEVGDEVKLRVLDASGKLTAGSLDDLAAEFRKNPTFAGIVTGSRATGDGGTATKQGGSNSAKQVDEATFLAMSQAQRSEFSRGGGRVI